MRVQKMIEECGKKIVVPKTVSKKASIGEIVSFNLQCIAKMKQLLNRYNESDLRLESGYRNNSKVS